MKTPTDPFPLPTRKHDHQEAKPNQDPTARGQNEAKKKKDPGIERNARRNSARKRRAGKEEQCKSMNKIKAGGSRRKETGDRKPRKTPSLPRKKKPAKHQYPIRPSPSRNTLNRRIQHPVRVSDWTGYPSCQTCPAQQQNIVSRPSLPYHNPPSISKPKPNDRPLTELLPNLLNQTSPCPFLCCHPPQIP